MPSRNREIWNDFPCLYCDIETQDVVRLEKSLTKTRARGGCLSAFWKSRIPRVNITVWTWKPFSYLLYKIMSRVKKKKFRPRILSYKHGYGPLRAFRRSSLFYWVVFFRCWWGRYSLVMQDKKYMFLSSLARSVLKFTLLFRYKTLLERTLGIYAVFSRKQSVKQVITERMWVSSYLKSLLESILIEKKFKYVNYTRFFVFLLFVFALLNTRKGW